MSLPLIALVKMESTKADLLTSKADCLVVGIGDNGALSTAAIDLDKLAGGWVSQSIKSGALKTKRGELTLMPAIPAIGTGTSAPATLMFVGVGDIEKLRRGQAFDLGAAMMRRLVDAPRERVVVSLAGLIADELHDAVVAGAMMGCDGESIYMAEPKINPPQVIAWHGFGDASIAQGAIIGDSINTTRRMVNEPANHIYPESFADAASAIAADVGLAIEVWDEKRLESEGCRAILAVGAASIRPPRLVIMKYQGGDNSQPWVALVGKGVTFDSGGLSIKPTDGMVDMKCDMAGAATVLGTMRAIALLKIKVNVIGLCGLAENMISGTAFKLGDVIEARNGTTIEILNTDAEGRVVLADTLDVAVQHKPVAIVDLATLTGACMVALGRDVAGLMTNDEPLCEALGQAAEAEGELVWKLPMFDFYGEQIKSKVADIKNTGDARWGGAITAAKFLECFVGNAPWVHIDIAGPAFAESSKPHRDAGATGVMLRTLVAWLNDRAAGKP